MKLVTILLCVFFLAVANRAAAQTTTPKPTHLPSSENIPAKLPPGIDIIRCPEWLTVNFDQSKTPTGWFSYKSFTTRATEAVVSKGKKPGKELLECVYGVAVLLREVTAGKCKVYDEKDAHWKSFECSR